MNDTNPPKPVPYRSPDTAAFWTATAERRLLVTYCSRCAEYIWYPRRFCPRCACLDISWREVSGRGTVYTFTVVHRTDLPEFRDAVPYVVGYVELDEGPRVMTNIVGIDPDQVHIGLPVSVLFEDPVFEENGDSWALFRFRPVG